MEGTSRETPAPASASAPAARGGFRLDRNEIAGAFGDLGTLIPFLVAYLAVVKLDPGAVLLAFGVAYIAVGAIYRTPFPVQPMKAIGAVATTQSVHAAALTPAAIQAAGLVTAAVWMVLAATGFAKRLADWTPRSLTLGIVLGLGLSLMLDGIRMMADGWWLAAGLLAATLFLIERRRFPAMFLVLVVGACVALWNDPALLGRLTAVDANPRLPSIDLGEIGWQQLWVGAVLLALPQVPLTLGNALIATVEQSNRLFPDRPVTERRVAFSTGLMNLGSGLVGGVPMCHGAGGMAGHVQFGAHTGAAPILIGVLLLAGGVLFADAVAIFFTAFPLPVLGVILFLAGAQLALGICALGNEKAERFVALTTAAFAVWHVGVAFVFGLALHVALRRGWVRL
jgi:MFS superfamily sulfate permease-like transporter